jgi:4-hydroxy-tetrahydrodipicolinate reductase
MKIALLGYGRMGKEIEKIALLRGHEIIIRKEHNEEHNISLADIAIDFSVPSAAFNNISDCFNNNVPVISGTTGWLEKYDEAVHLCKEKKGCFYLCFKF